MIHVREQSRFFGCPRSSDIRVGGQKYVVVVAVQLALGSLKRQFSLHAAVYICRASMLDVYMYRRRHIVLTVCALCAALPCKRFLQH